MNRSIWIARREETTVELTSLMKGARQKAWHSVGHVRVGRHVNGRGFAANHESPTLLHDQVSDVIFRPPRLDQKVTLIASCMILSPALVRGRPKFALRVKVDPVTL